MPSSEQPEVVTAPKKRILLVDDDPDFTSLIKLNLEETGEYEVREENRPEHALAAARAFKPDLILLDMMMPNVRGGKVAAQLRGDEALRETPVMFLTAMLSREEAHSTKIGGYPSIAKPVSPEELVELIEKYVDKGTKQRAMTQRRSEETLATPMRKKRILLIDHEGDFSASLKLDIDKTSEYEALIAISGEAGLELVKTHKPDLVLLDIMMPDMDGIRTLKRIKATAPNLPVAMVTAVWKEKEAIRCFEAGATEYITKPVDFEFLKTALLVKLL